MPNAMDYDALAKMYSSEQDPRRLTMNDALQNYSRQQKIEALIAEARNQQQWSNQQEELKNAAHIKQSNALANNYARDKTNQWQADQAENQRYNREVVPMIAAYHAIGDYDRLLADPNVSEKFKKSLLNVPTEKRSDWMSAQLGFSPRDKTVAGLQNTDKKVAGSITTTGMRGAFDLEKARIQAAAKLASANKGEPNGMKMAKNWEQYSITLDELAKKETDPAKRAALFEESVYNKNLALRKYSESQLARKADTPDWSKAGGQNMPTKPGPVPVQLPPSAGKGTTAPESNKAKLKALWENGQ